MINQVSSNDCKLKYLIMKKLTFCIISFVVSIFSYGQLRDGSFEVVSNGCTTNVNTSCDENRHCNPYWYASHGTPNVFTDASAQHGNKYAYMWAQYSGGDQLPNGEGFYTDYTFYAGYSYTIRLSVRMANATMPTNGSFRVVAVNGLNQPDPSTCTNVPNPAEKQTILEITNLTRTWTTYTVTYTPTSNGQPFTYNQFWVYPYIDQWPRTSSNGPKLEVNVDRVCISGYTNTCFPKGYTYTMKNIPETTSPPYYRRARWFFAGSHFGIFPNTFVKTSSNWTHLIAGDFALLAPNFETNVSTSAFEIAINSCDAYTENCSDGSGHTIMLAQNPITNEMDSISGYNNDTATFIGNPDYNPNEGQSGGGPIEVKRKPEKIGEVEINNGINIYPNPAKDQLVITIPNRSEFTKVRILNSNGILIDDFLVNQRNLIPYQTKNLIPGVYIIEIVSPKKVVIKKFIVIK